MSRTKSADRLAAEESLFAAIDNGKSINAAANELGLDRRRAYAWAKARVGAQAPDEVASPKPPTPPPSEPTKVGKKGARPITEKTAAKLLEMAFLFLAIRQSEPLWLLDEADKDILGSPLADSLAMIPGPIADVVNRYAAPGVFLGSLIGVVEAKQRRIKAKKGAGATYGAPRGVPTPPRTDAAQPAPPPPSAPTPPIGDLASAVAAAKGGLTNLDEISDTERELH